MDIPLAQNLQRKQDMVQSAIRNLLKRINYNEVYSTMNKEQLQIEVQNQIPIIRGNELILLEMRDKVEDLQKMIFSKKAMVLNEVYDEEDFDKKKKFSNDRLRTIELQTRLGNDIEYQDNVTKLDGVQRGMDTLRIYTEELKRTVELNLWVLKTQS